MKHSVADDQLREQLALYALEALSQHEARIVENHLAEGCEVCDAELKPFESVVAALGFSSPSVDPPAKLREQLVVRLAEEVRISNDMKTALQFYNLRANEGEWRESAAGLFEKQLFADESRRTVTTLIKMLPGTACPSHRHLGIEECLVVAGDFHVNGEVYNAGDYRCAMAGSIDEGAHSVNGNLLLIVSQGGYEMVAHG